MRETLRNKLALGLVLGLCGLASGAVLLPRTESVKFQGDESGWISAAGYYTDLLLGLDFEWEKWECPRCTAWGSLNPHLGKWLIGIPMKLADPRQPQFFGIYDHRYPPEANRIQKRLPPTDVLMQARAASAVFGGLCCVLLLALGWTWLGPPAGILAAGLLLGNPLFRNAVTRAMTDAHYSFFLLGCCAASAALLCGDKPWRPGRTGAVSGLAAGLACSVKLSGLAVASLLFGFALGLRCLVLRPALRQVLASTGAFVLTALAVVYALNPFFWPALGGLKAGPLAAEVRAYCQDPVGMDELRQRHPQMFRLAHVLEFPRLFVRWSRFLETQSHLQTVGVERGRPKVAPAGWQGGKLLEFHRLLFVQYSTFRGEWIFLAAGSLWSCARIRESIRTRQLTASSLPFLFFAANYLLMLSVQNVTWGRYFLPGLVAGRLLVAIGIEQSLRQALAALRRLRPA